MKLKTPSRRLAAPAPSGATLPPEESIIDEMAKLVSALQEHLRWNDNTFTLGVYPQVKCKPVFYITEKVYKFLSAFYIFRHVVDEDHFFFEGGIPTFMGIEVRVFADHPKVANFALAFEPVEMSVLEKDKAQGKSKRTIFSTPTAPSRCATSHPNDKE